MPALQTISITDGAATPAAHVFSPVNSSGSVAEFANRAATIPSGMERLSIDVRQPASPTGAHRVIVGLQRPTVGAVDGQDQVVRDSKNSFNLNFSQNSTKQERKDTLALLRSLCGDPSFVTAVTDLEPYY